MWGTVQYIFITTSRPLKIKIPENKIIWLVPLLGLLTKLAIKMSKMLNYGLKGGIFLIIIWFHFTQCYTSYPMAKLFKITNLKKNRIVLGASFWDQGQILYQKYFQKYKHMLPWQSWCPRPLFEQIRVTMKNGLLLSHWWLYIVYFSTHWLLFEEIE